jgi:hypothetical protein
VSDVVAMAAARRRQCAVCGCSVAESAAVVGNTSAIESGAEAAAQPLVGASLPDSPTSAERSLDASLCGDAAKSEVAPRAEARPHPLFPLAPSIPSLPNCTCTVPTQPSTTLLVVEGARHAFAGKVPQRTLLRAVTEWLLKQAIALKVPVTPLAPSAAEAGSAAVAAAKAARGAAVAGKGKARDVLRTGAGRGSAGDASRAEGAAAVVTEAQGRKEGAGALMMLDASGSSDASPAIPASGPSTVSDAPIAC